MLETLAVALAIFLLRVLGNAITTFRLIMLARGKELITAILGFFESLVFAVALGAVVTNLDSIINLIAYAGGYAVGSSVGMWMERRMTLGYVSIHVVSRNDGHKVANAIRDAGYGATEIIGHGADSDVLVIESVIERHNMEECINVIQGVDDDAFITTQTLQSTRRGYVPAVRPGLTRLVNRMRHHQS